MPRLMHKMGGEGIWEACGGGGGKEGGDGGEIWEVWGMEIQETLCFYRFFIKILQKPYVFIGFSLKYCKNHMFL